MGYHVYITREKNGVDSDIPLEDWLQHVASTPELEFEKPQGDDLASQFTRSVHAAHWSGAAEEYAWLGWSHGEIWTKNPPEKLIGYMIEIAPKFGARVRGDEGEYYRTLDDVYYEEDGRVVSQEEQNQRQAASAAFHKKKRLMWNILRLLLLLMAAYFLTRQNFR
ncbi:hypothetical protein DES53_11346 [Roseimicrobium gellanilyticum]|uniref:Uncharacterized protein n=1 Tax=Roseimicrobium gellanilyticum TaxID=748857 RepID=A0A366H6N6_9BACT|nr:hypothetical protein [Roseimicrobium gellanilyticum]RBP37664.1 hypothetical protein DES53_11346 [Roseimicrobium gellanilyticum]